MPKLPSTEGIDALIQEYDMIPPGSTVICALSGGADSVYLLSCLYYRRLSHSFTLVAAHYNHHLRGEESDRDERFVRELVAQRFGPRVNTPGLDLPGVELIVGHGDVAAEAKKRKQGIEETAREMRYAFLQETAKKLGGALIATAHNADDNAETLLLHLVRGTGLQGLTGISPKQGNLIRPMLTTNRQWIEQYLKICALPHVEDSSNSDQRYTRNRIRAQIMPVLWELNPRFALSATTTARFLREDNDYLNAQAALISAQAIRETQEISIPAALIAEAPHPIAVRVVRQLMTQLNSGVWDCAATHLEDIISLCQRSNPSAVLYLPHGLTARREYDTLVLTTQADTGPVWTAFSPVEGVNPVPGTGWGAVLAGPPWPGLAVRPRQTGDAVTLPNGHTRSLKKLFIDRKIPRPERDIIPIAADGDGVIAVAGLVENSAHPCAGRITFIKIAEKEENGQ